MEGSANQSPFGVVMGTPPVACATCSYRMNYFLIVMIIMEILDSMENMDEIGRAIKEAMTTQTILHISLAHGRLCLAGTLAAQALSNDPSAICAATTANSSPFRDCLSGLTAAQTDSARNRSFRSWAPEIVMARFLKPDPAPLTTPGRLHTQLPRSFQSMLGARA